MLQLLILKTYVMLVRISKDNDKKGGKKKEGEEERGKKMQVQN